jgi:hypothetical protein
MSRVFKRFRFEIAVCSELGRSLQLFFLFIMLSYNWMLIAILYFKFFMFYFLRTPLRAQLALSCTQSAKQSPSIGPASQSSVDLPKDPSRPTPELQVTEHQELPCMARTLRAVELRCTDRKLRCTMPDRGPPITAGWRHHTLHTKTVPELQEDLQPGTRRWRTLRLRAETTTTTTSTTRLRRQTTTPEHQEEVANQAAATKVLPARPTLPRHPARSTIHRRDILLTTRHRPVPRRVRIHMCWPLHPVRLIRPRLLRTMRLRLRASATLPWHPEVIRRTRHRRQDIQRSEIQLDRR